MAGEEHRKIEEGETVAETASDPPPPPTESPDEKKSAITTPPAVDDSKARAVVEKPSETLEEKTSEGSINRDVVLAHVATEKTVSLIKAWEESEKSKAENKAQKKLSTIGAWERSRQAEIEAELKKFEEELEKKKAKYVEKVKNKIALIHRKAEEKRAIIEARKGEDLLKAEETAAKHRASGTSPVKAGCFGF